MQIPIIREKYNILLEVLRWEQMYCSLAPKYLVHIRHLPATKIVSSLDFNFTSKHTVAFMHTVSFPSTRQFFFWIFTLLGSKFMVTLTTATSRDLQTETMTITPQSSYFINAIIMGVQCECTDGDSFLCIVGLAGFTFFGDF